MVGNLVVLTLYLEKKMGKLIVLTPVYRKEAG